MLLLQSRKGIAHFTVFSTMVYQQHVLCPPYCRLYRPSVNVIVPSTVHFNTDISRTLLDLIANYDTSLLVSDVRTNCAASNDAHVDDGRTRFVPETIALFLKIIFCILAV